MTDLVPHRHKVFYGWWVVAAVFFISFYMAGTVNFGFTAFFEPIAQEFAWSYTQVSFAASIRGMESGIFAPLVGLLIDRFGPKKVVFVGVAVFGLGFLLLGRITSLSAYYWSFFLIAIGVSACIGVVPMTVAGRWFGKSATLVTGIVVSGVALGGLLIPVVSHVIDVFEWRQATLIFGLACWILLLPLSLLVRDRTERDNTSPRYDVADKPDSSEKITSVNSIDDINIGVGQALKSRAFWHFLLGLVCLGIMANSVATHVMPYMSTIGISRSTASLIASFIPLTSIIGRVGFGWLGDRFDKRKIMASGIALTGFGMLFFGGINMERTWFVVPFLIFFGIGNGGTVPMVSALIREYFGARKLGTLLGITMGLMQIGMIIGPPLTGWVFDTFGSYQGAWFAFIGVAIIGTLSLLAMPPSSKMRRTVNNA